MKCAVVGQTGKVVLSDEKNQYKLDRKRTVRYQYTRIKCGFIAWVCGPFHSRMYGACGFGTRKVSAKRALADNLARNYRYIGNMMFSDVDESDTVGHAVRDWNGKDCVPITQSQACGKAGQ